MASRWIVREKVLRLAVRTGSAVDLDLIWDIQRWEGCSLCFGSYSSSECQGRCRWYELCKTVAIEPVDAPWPPLLPPESIPQGDELADSAERLIEYAAL